MVPIHWNVDVTIEQLIAEHGNGGGGEGEEGERERRKGRKEEREEESGDIGMFRCTDPFEC